MKQTLEEAAENELLHSYSNGYNGNGGIAYSFAGASDKKYIGLYDPPHEAFATLIDKVSGKGKWEENPFVWVYEFVLWD